MNVLQRQCSCIARFDQGPQLLLVGGVELFVRVHPQDPFPRCMFRSAIACLCKASFPGMIHYGSPERMTEGPVRRARIDHDDLVYDGKHALQSQRILLRFIFGDHAQRDQGSCHQALTVPSSHLL